MRPPIIAVIFAICLMGFQSEPPVPAPAEKKQNVKQPSKGKSSEPKADQEAPQVGPPVGGINIPLEPKGVGKVAAKDEEGKSEREWWMIGLTAALVFCGGVQVWTMYKQASLTREALKTTHESFIASQSPRLTIRCVGTDDDSVLRVRTPAEFEVVREREFQNSVSGLFQVANSGGTSAVIDCSFTDFIIGTRLPPISKFAYCQPEVSNQSSGEKLLPGQSTVMGFPAVKPWFISYDQLVSLNDGTNSIYLIGWIQYSDDLNRKRKSFFCRRWNMLTKCFERVQNEDYEYAD